MDWTKPKIEEVTNNTAEAPAAEIEPATDEVSAEKKKEVKEVPNPVPQIARRNKIVEKAAPLIGDKDFVCSCNCFRGYTKTLNEAISHFMLQEQQKANAEQKRYNLTLWNKTT